MMMNVRKYGCQVGHIYDDDGGGSVITDNNNDDQMWSLHRPLFSVR